MPRPRGSKNRPKVNADGIKILKSRKPRVKKVNWYWTDEHDQLLIDYVRAGSKAERSTIYSKLQKVVRKMSEIVLKRYFLINTTNHLTQRELQDLITDCEIHLIELSFPLYNPEKGKGFAFVGTCAKKYFYNVFYQKPKSNVHDNIYDLETGEIKHDIPVEPEEFEIENTLLYDKAFARINSIYEQALAVKLSTGTNPSTYKKKENLVLVLGLIIDFMNEYKNKKYSKWLLTYYLLKNTNFQIYYLYRLLRDVEIGTIIVGTRRITVEYLENLYAVSNSKYSFEEWLTEYKEETPSSYLSTSDTRTKKYEKRAEKVKERNKIKEQESETLS